VVLADPPIVGNLEFSWTPASSSGAGWVDHASHYELQIGTDVKLLQRYLHVVHDRPDDIHAIRAGNQWQ